MSMDYEMTQKFKNELMSNETLLWSGQSRQGIVFQAFDIFMIPFSLLWGGGVISAAVMMIYQGGNWMLLFPLMFISLFVLVGLYMIFGRFIVDIMIRKRTFYGITNERVLILSEFPTWKLKSLNLNTMSDISYTKKAKGRGTISFGAEMKLGVAGMHFPGMNNFQGPQFELIEDVDKVYNIVRDLQKKNV